MTSGATKTALEGAKRLHQLQAKFGIRVSLIAGGGVRSTNVEELKRRTGAGWLHSAAITRSGEDVDEEEVKRMQHVLVNFGQNQDKTY